jgi:AAA domain-containing protein
VLDTTPDPLRPAFEALSAADGPTAKLNALKRVATDLSTPIRHGLLDYYEIEERLLDLAKTQGLIDDLTLGTIEGVIVRALKTPALRGDAPSANGHSFDLLPDDEWQAPTEVPAGPAANEEPRGTSSEDKSPPLIQSSAQFTNGFIPPDYLVDGILQRRFIYSLTGRTGSGKSAIALLITASVALGRPIGSRDVQKGRVLYFAGENPDDIRMRWIAMAQYMDFDVDQVDVCFIAGTFKISEMASRIAQEADKAGPFALVVVDTSAAFYEGDDENSNAQQGVHARRLRSLVQLPGGPCVIANCHPPKNAPESNLQPRGGGAFIAEMDGNLTTSKDDGVVTLHWQGKFRGPDFAPISFQLKTITNEHLKDTKGRTIPTIIASYLSETAQEEIAATARGNENRVLALIASDQSASYAQMARTLGWTLRSGEPNKMAVSRVVKKLKEAKLVTIERDKPVITDKAKKILTDVTASPANAEENTSV